MKAILVSLILIFPACSLKAAVDADTVFAQKWVIEKANSRTKNIIECLYNALMEKNLGNTDSLVVVFKFYTTKFMTGSVNEGLERAKKAKKRCKPVVSEGTIFYYVAGDNPKSDNKLQGTAELLVIKRRDFKKFSEKNSGLTLSNN